MGRKIDSHTRNERKSRSRSNNNIKNANKVPLNRDRPTSRNKSRSRGRPTSRIRSRSGGKREQDDTFRGSRRTRSSSRTKSIQEKLLMLSQGQHHLAPKENFTVNKRRSLSRDNN